MCLSSPTVREEGALGGRQGPGGGGLLVGVSVGVLVGVCMSPLERLYTS